MLFDAADIRPEIKDAQDALVPELHQVTVLYAETFKRLHDHGTSENDVSWADYAAAVRIQAEYLHGMYHVPGSSDEDLYRSMISLSTVLLRWARQVRNKCQSPDMTQYTT